MCAQDFQGKFVQDGLSVDYTPGADVDAGDVVVQNNVVGIAKRDIDFDASETGALALSGIFDIVKKEEAFATVGANIYWDATGDPYEGTAGTGAATATATANTFMGYVLETADSTDEVVRVLLRSTIAYAGEGFSLADLSDIDAVAYTAGLLLVGTGTKFADVALSGPFGLAATGLMSMASATVAAAGSVQGDAASVAQGFTLASAANGTKGVKLPTAAAGAMCIIKNNANAVLKIWPASSDAIDAIAADNEIEIGAYSTIRLVSYNTVTWYSEAFTLAELADIDAVTYTAGNMLVGSGTKFASVAASGPFTMSSAGKIAVASATVAAAGSVQGDAGAVAEGFTLVSAADATKGVVLPAATIGARCVLKNNANAVLKVWPNVSDAIDAVAVDNELEIPAYATVTLTAYDATTWYSEYFTLASLADIDAVAYTAGKMLVGSGTKYADVALSGPFGLAASGLMSVASATVAAAGSAQNDATVVAQGFTLVTAADATKGCKLPAAAAGSMCIIKNADAANAILKIWPNTDDAINAIAANSSLDIAAKTSLVLVAYDATTWYSIPLLPS